MAIMEQNLSFTLFCTENIIFLMQLFFKNFKKKQNKKKTKKKNKKKTANLSYFGGNFKLPNGVKLAYFRL